MQKIITITLDWDETNHDEILDLIISQIKDGMISGQNEKEDGSYRFSVQSNID